MIRRIGMKSAGVITCGICPSPKTGYICIIEQAAPADNRQCALISGRPEERGMRISTKGRYALRMMLDLAIHDTGEYISLKDISERQGVTVKYLEQIVTALTRSGMVRSQRGNNGGYRLTKRPSEYTAGDILRVMEGPLSPAPCAEDGSNCDRSGDCAVMPFWRNFAKVINEYVDSVTLQDLKDQANALNGNDFVI